MWKVLLVEYEFIRVILLNYQGTMYRALSTFIYLLIFDDY